MANGVGVPVALATRGDPRWVMTEVLLLTSALTGQPPADTALSAASVAASSPAPAQQGPDPAPDPGHCKGPAALALGVMVGVNAGEWHWLFTDDMSVGVPGAWLPLAQAKTAPNGTVNAAAPDRDPAHEDDVDGVEVPLVDLAVALGVLGWPKLRSSKT